MSRFRFDEEDRKGDFPGAEKRQKTCRFQGQSADILKRACDFCTQNSGNIGTARQTSSRRNYRRSRRGDAAQRGNY
jgi:hypothetical protein